MPAIGAGTPAPFGLTAAHFAAALAFLVVGAAGVVWVAPDLAAGHYLMPRVAAVTHLFTLGWITTSIMGALYQLFPVVLGTGIPSFRAGYAALALYAPGLVLLAAGLAAGVAALLLTGAVLLAAGLLVFLANAGTGLVRALNRDATWWTLAAAFVFLFVTVALGASLAGNLRWSFLGANRLVAVAVHMHVALGGWVLLVIVGVARRLLPMFLLSHGADSRPGRAAALLIGAGAGTLTLFHHGPDRMISVVAPVLLAAGTAAFVVQAALYVRHANRPRLDPGLRLAMGGIGLLVAALVLGCAGAATRFGSTRLTAAYGVALVVGAFTAFVAGHYYKILPFLVWNHRFAGLVGGGRRLPRVADLFSARTADIAGILILAGAAGLAAAVAAGHAPGARAAAAVFCTGAAVLATQMSGLIRKGPDT
ncbi:MAG TPA: hypothetical protein VK936_04520 [Longimicrobiales bacterium]|nr:hypothetical protein [Longimicrobiales bacterium]